MGAQRQEQPRPLNYTSLSFAGFLFTSGIFMGGTRSLLVSITVLAGSSLLCVMRWNSKNWTQRKIMKKFITVRSITLFVRDTRETHLGI